MEYRKYTYMRMIFSGYTIAYNSYQALTTNNDDKNRGLVAC